MKIYLQILLGVAALLAIIVQTNGLFIKRKEPEIIHTEAKWPGGEWRNVRNEWKARWVQEWEAKKIYVPIWKKVWGPVEIREWVPFPKPPPGWGPVDESKEHHHAPEEHQHHEEHQQQEHHQQEHHQQEHHQQEHNHHEEHHQQEHNHHEQHHQQEHHHPEPNPEPFVPQNYLPAEPQHPDAPHPVYLPTDGQQQPTLETIIVQASEQHSVHHEVPQNLEEHPEPRNSAEQLGGDAKQAINILPN